MPLVAVSRETHADKVWTRFDNYGFAARRQVVPVVLAEVAKVSSTMPIALLKDGDAFVAVGLLSLVPDTNMFVSADGAWLGGYVPAFLRGHPFALARGSDGREGILCVDDSHLRPAGEAGERFFEADGTLTKAVSDVLKFLGDLEQSRAQTRAAVASLAAADVLKPWPLEAAGDPPRRFEGLYRVDEAAMTALPDEAFLGLRRSGALPFAYAHLLSMQQVSVFERLVALRDQLARMQAAKKPEPAFSLGSDQELFF
ncbi:SapC family protein [Salinarimonas ramus]|uniref:SapC protein n=1 Tax=Salinarimonas ramus TaxID=690164 RepID=A0A917QFS1_9HYPH|nr:SapC family protein [Salinarimonas ramus]GGK46911.1 hypothetical protein GCM10011322_37500 [Salinarimonas ramus]